MARLKKYYVIEKNGYNQAGDITEVKLSKKDFENIYQSKIYNNRSIYTILDNYYVALYITQN